MFPRCYNIVIHSYGGSRLFVKYVGVPIFFNAFIIRSQLVELNAFFTSSFLMIQYFFDPCFELLPSIVFIAVFTTSFTAFNVDRAFWKLYWWYWKLYRVNLFRIVLSSIFPVVSRKQIGRYDNGSPDGLPCLGRALSFVFPMLLEDAFL